MNIPQLETCCCGCSLKTGSTIIGWFYLVVGVVNLIMFGMALKGLYYIEDNPNINPFDAMGAYGLNIHLTAFRVFTMMLVILSIFICGLACILLVGINQEKPQLLFTWVVVTLTVVCFELTINIAQMCLGTPSAGYISISIFCLQVYFILVVYSYYRQVKNDPNCT